MTKAPTPTEMSKGQSDNTNNATKSSIKQQLRTDLRRSVGVTRATQLVWGSLRSPSNTDTGPFRQPPRLDPAMVPWDSNSKHNDGHYAVLVSKDLVQIHCAKGVNIL